jgi:hypothetical protein
VDDQNLTAEQDDVDETSEADPEAQEEAPEPTAVAHVDFAQWHGKNLVDQAGEVIGRLEDVYFDIESDQPQFGTVKEGGLFVKRHLTFVPLIDVTVGPDYLQAAVSKAQVRDAPNIDLEGDELSQTDESVLYHYYQLNYTPTSAPSGRRLARR